MRTTYCLLGTSGFVGSHLLGALEREASVRLRLLGHRRSIAVPEGAEVVFGSASDAATLDQLLEPGAVVINSVFTGGSTEAAVSAARSFAQACTRRRIRRLVHVSTAVVPGRGSDRVVDESTACVPISVYERSKLAVENVLIEASRDAFELVVLRPTAIFGPGGRNLISLAERVARGATLERYIWSCMMGRRHMHAVDVSAVTCALLFLARYETFESPQVFLLSDDEAPDNNYLGVEQLMAETMGTGGRQLPIVVLPDRLLTALLRIRGRSDIEPHRIYSWDKLHRLGFRKPHSFRQAVQRFARWFMQRNGITPSRS